MNAFIVELLKYSSTLHDLRKKINSFCNHINLKQKLF